MASIIKGEGVKRRSRPTRIERKPVPFPHRTRTVAQKKNSCCTFLSLDSFSLRFVYRKRWIIPFISSSATVIYYRIEEKMFENVFFSGVIFPTYVFPERSSL
ncbi:hypothetical protein NPIL_3141 [Nephila pilipes]|uniref:Uncharacterized protein n=1 Tax=Nephila pilipes TaxID=299642 RepID=A0A8X6MXH5_NEPPI|nr:hypothetical protein NPIL_3141 [Nephila pilipes]